MELRIVLSILVTPILAFVCDQARPPVLYNELDHVIELQVDYSDGQSLTERVPPGASMWAPADGIDLEGVRAYSNGELLFQANRRQLAAMLNTIDPDHGVVWRVSAQGLSPVALEEWRPD